MNLLLVLPLTASTLPAAQSLLTRMYAWEPLRNNSILIVRDFPLTEEQCKPVLKVAEEIFSGGRASGEVIRTPMILPDPSYPYTYNFLFETAIKHIALRRKCPFLWLDPHCVPVRKGWIQTLEAEYQACGKPFLGHILTPARHNTPYPIMAAPAVYPAQMPKVILQRLISKRQTAWELSCADVIVQNAFASKLIHSIPNNGKPMVFTRGTHPGTVDINTIPSDALLVHTTGYKSLIAAYAGETQALPQAPVVKVAKEKPAGYYHSGNLGDIIYGLYAIKKAGGGKLYLGPKQLRTSPARSPIKQADYDRMAPLLSAQSYITSHAFSPRHPGTDNAFDMNIYRNKWDDREFRERAHISTLIQMQCHVLGVEEKFRQDEAWLTVPKPIQTGMFVCHRSERYRDKEFPWPKILEALKGRLLFIGLNSEHTQFCDEMDTTIPFWKCGDFLDMASVIAGSLGFIGNQSFPMSLALALNKPVIQETSPNAPDCLMVRPNFINQPLTEPKIEEWVRKCTPHQKVSLAAQKGIKTKGPGPIQPKGIFSLSGHIDIGSGYGGYTIQLCREIMKSGYNLQLRPISCNENEGPVPSDIRAKFIDINKPSQTDWSFIIFPCVIQPGNLVLPGTKVAYMTMWEATRLTSQCDEYAKDICKDIVGIMNRCQVVIVPNAWNATIFSACGVDSPIRVAPLCIDVESFPVTPNNVEGDVLVFGTAGRTKIGGVRKGFNIVVEAFKQAFPTEKNVRLHTKCFMDDPPILHNNDSRIVETRRFLNTEELRQWYAGINVFASGSASEGWGRHQQEAMCMGRPVIGINFGGVCEFFNEENGYPVDWKLVPGDGIYKTMGHYARPSVDSMAEQMRRAYEDRWTLKQKIHLAKTSARRFTPRYSLECIENIIREFKFIP